MSLLGNDNVRLFYPDDAESPSLFPNTLSMLNLLFHFHFQILTEVYLSCGFFWFERWKKFVVDNSFRFMLCCVSEFFRPMRPNCHDSAAFCFPILLVYILCDFRLIVHELVTCTKLGCCIDFSHQYSRSPFGASVF